MIPRVQSGERSEYYSQPEFILADSGNVTAILGKTASLTCRVRAVGNRTVRQGAELVNVLSVM